MNKVILIGRLTRDPEIKYTQAAEPLAVIRFTIAVDRPFARKNDDEKTADFLNCVCFGKRAETIGQYFKKGNKIAVTGRIQTGEYTDQNGNRRFTTDIVVEDFEFVESKKAAATDQEASSYSSDGFYAVDDDDDDDDLPF